MEDNKSWRVVSQKAHFVQKNVSYEDKGGSIAKDVKYNKWLSSVFRGEVVEVRNPLPGAGGDAGFEYRSSLIKQVTRFMTSNQAAGSKTIPSQKILLNNGSAGNVGRNQKLQKRLKIVVGKQLHMFFQATLLTKYI
jgi:hypothetical protein